MANKNTKTIQNPKKEPLYRKWWFWVILLLVLGAACLFGWMAVKQSKTIEFETAAGVVTYDGVPESEVGETVDFNGGQLTVKSVDYNYASDKAILESDKDNRYVRVTVDIKNTSNQPYQSNALYWALLADNKNVDGTATIQYSEDEAIDSSEIAPGETETGYLFFPMPESDGELVLFYTPEIGQNEVLSVKLR